MIQLYDINNQAESPPIILCNPSKEELFSLSGLIYDTKITKRFNALSEFLFTIPSTTDGGTTTLECYEYIQAKRLISIENYGYFIIDNVEEKTDGKPVIKIVSCKSLEQELMFKRFTAFTGTFKFYNVISDPNVVTLMDRVLQLLPTWTAGIIDTTVALKYRTFNVNDKTVYGFLMEDAEKAYECIFQFDTVAKTINVYSTTNAVTPTDIYLSYDNVIKNSTFSEISDEVVTALYVTGSDNLDIRAVNPLGTNIIYDFTYYKNTDWMSGSLVTAVTNWENAVLAAQPTYAGYLTDLRILNTTMITLQSDLMTLQGQYTAKETEQKTAIQVGLPINTINAELQALGAQITAKQASIVAQQVLIDAKTAQITAINTSLSFNNNFTNDEFLELTSFIFENTYQNNTYVVTDLTTAVEYQDTAQELYNQGLSVLSRVSLPRYEFKMDAANFVALKEFSTFTTQLDLGTTVTINVNDNFEIIPVLLEITMSFDNPEEFSLTFSNRLRLDGANFQYADLLGQMYSTSSTVLGNTQNWNNWNSNYKDTVSTFITSALDASLNSVINSSNQEILINTNGLKARYLDPNTNTYNQNQLWLTRNLIVFTSDNWNTARLALGEIEYNGNKLFGLISDVLVGRILAGNNLSITNEGSNFTLDQAGARLNNASFILQNNKNTIVLTPNEETVNGIVTNGISIQSYNDSTSSWENVFYTDVNGNLILRGGVTAEFGSFGGWTITNVGISDTHGNYINSNGYVKLGGLTIEPGSLRVAGDIYANNLYGRVVNASNYQFGSITPPAIGFLDAGLITTGILNAGLLYWTGAIRGPGINYKSEIDFDKGYLEISGDEGVRVHATPIFYVDGGISKMAGDIFVKKQFISISSDLITLDGSNGGTIQLGTKTGDKIVVGGPGGGTGITTNFSIKDIFGVTQNLIFSKGILTDGKPPPDGELDSSGASGGTGRTLRFMAIDSMGVTRTFIFTKGIFNDGIEYLPVGDIIPTPPPTSPPPTPDPATCNESSPRTGPIPLIWSVYWVDSSTYAIAWKSCIIRPSYATYQSYITFQLRMKIGIPFSKIHLYAIGGDQSIFLTANLSYTDGGTSDGSQIYNVTATFDSLLGVLVSGFKLTIDPEEIIIGGGLPFTEQFKEFAIRNASGWHYPTEGDGWSRTYYDPTNGRATYTFYDIQYAPIQWILGVVWQMNVNFSSGAGIIGDLWGHINWIGTSTWSDHPVQINGLVSNPDGVSLPIDWSYNVWHRYAINSQLVQFSPYTGNTGLQMASTQSIPDDPNNQTVSVSGTIDFWFVQPGSTTFLPRADFGTGSLYNVCL